MYDVLSPYERKFGGRLNHRQVRECHTILYGTAPYEIDNITDDNTDNGSSAIEVKSFLHSKDGMFVTGHVAFIKDPVNTVSVEEPLNGGCRLKGRSKVSDVAQLHGCVVAVNGGFFNMDTDQCYGNVVSNGHLRYSSGVQNANFGITKDNELFAGYLPRELLKNEAKEFQQLIAGVIWLVRGGKIYINDSIKVECEEHQTTGTFDKFVNIRSARTAVGYDKKGRVIIAQVNGKTGLFGINLWQMANLMIKFGAVNAINLDGGGSSTFTVNGTVVGALSDDCEDIDFRCERHVTTVLCAKNKQPMNLKNVGSVEVEKEDSRFTKESNTKEIITMSYIIAVISTVICFISFFVNVFLCYKMYKLKRSRNGRPSSAHYVTVNVQSSDEDETVT